jgi:putative endonuclease
VRNGYSILGTNVRVGYGEIDIIAQRDEVIVICEVKTRTSREFGDPGEALTAAKQRTVRTAAFGWAKLNNVASWRLRFDLACVVGTRLEMLPDSF